QELPATVGVLVILGLRLAAAQRRLAVELRRRQRLRRRWGFRGFRDRGPAGERDRRLDARLVVRQELGEVAPDRGRTVRSKTANCRHGTPSIWWRASSSTRLRSRPPEPLVFG